MNSTQKEWITVPLGETAHSLARAFAAEQNSPQQGKRTYLNTLAVYATHSYLKWLQIETTLEDGDSWYPIFNVADLMVMGVGKLECCPVLPGQISFELPKLGQTDRIGYVAVQFKDTLTEVDLLGFTLGSEHNTPPYEVKVDDLKPIEETVAHLDFIRQSMEWLEGDDLVAVRVREIIDQRPLEVIVAQLNRIIKTKPEARQVYAVEDVLKGDDTPREVVLKSRNTFGSGQEDFTEVAAEELLYELAEDLLAKLKEIGGDR